MWHDYHEVEMVRREDYDQIVEELGESLVANQVLQAEVDAWKHTAARALKALDELVYESRIDGGKTGYLAPTRNRAEALLRELGAHRDSPADARSRELDEALQQVRAD